MATSDLPPIRGYRRPAGGRPGLNVDFVAVCDAVARARIDGAETMTDVAARFGVSRGWLHKWVYPALASLGGDRVQGRRRYVQSSQAAPQRESCAP